ncbi:MAG: metallophosphoesterase family protein [Bacteroidales bacterium]
MIYAISDIHGCFKTLQLLFKQLESISAENKYYFLGDYIDRGPDSRKVLDFLMNLSKKNKDVVILRGNHEQMMFDNYNNCSKENFLLWKENGCETTLLNFDIPANHGYEIADLPHEYIDFINSMPYYAESDEFLMAHAGFNFQSSNPFTDTQSMLWMRTDDYDVKISKGKKVIHGHTQIPLNQILQKLNNKSNVISIDSGCVYNKYKDLGWLSAFNLSTFELISVKNIDN